ncbi:MAG: protein kinase [Cryomorphaceae bacterium]|nr:protein kinase [Cryomorphaceae bacterium]
MKMLRDDRMSDSVTVLRFEQEARICARFRHPNLISVYDYDTTDSGVPYLVMDYVSGVTLRKLLEARAKLTSSEAIGLALQLCDALAYVHDSELVHRDLKPENLLISEESNGNSLLRILDFGIAKDAGVFSEIQRLTQTGEVFGTPEYMSPEQCSGGDIDSRSDIYSLGCILFEILSGRPPFRGAFMEVMEKQVDDTPVFAVTEVECPDRLKGIVLRCLEKEPDRRYQSAADLKSDLLFVQHKTAQPQVKPLAVAAGALVLAGALSLPFFFLGNHSEVRKSPEREARASIMPEVMLAQIIDSSGGETDDSLAESLLNKTFRSSAVATQDRVFAAFLLLDDLSFKYRRTATKFDSEILSQMNSTILGVSRLTNGIDSSEENRQVFFCAAQCHHILSECLRARAYEYEGLSSRRVLSDSPVPRMTLSETNEKDPKLQRIYMDSLIASRKAVSLVEKIELGSSYEKLVVSYFYQGLGASQIALRKYEEGLESLETVERLASATPGYRSLESYAYLQEYFGHVFFYKRDYRKAVEHFQQAIAIFSQRRTYARQYTGILRYLNSAVEDCRTRIDKGRRRSQSG